MVGQSVPSAPPSLKPKRGARPSWNHRASRHERGYDRQHELMRERVLREEPLCRPCLAKQPPEYAASTIADHIIPKAEGGGDERENYQGSCDPCHRAKTAEEAARGRRRRGGGVKV